MEAKNAATTPAGLRARRVALLYFVVVLGAYGLSFLLGLSWLPTPGVPASTPQLTRYPYGYDNYSYSSAYALTASGHGCDRVSPDLAALFTPRFQG